jgi:hypothetical protein
MRFKMGDQVIWVTNYDSFDGFDQVKNGKVPIRVVSGGENTCLIDFEHPKLHRISWYIANSHLRLAYGLLFIDNDLYS